MSLRSSAPCARERTVFASEKCGPFSRPKFDNISASFFAPSIIILSGIKLQSSSDFRVTAGTLKFFI
jgi:hypothetical protein